MEYGKITMINRHNSDPSGNGFWRYGFMQLTLMICLLGGGLQSSKLAAETFEVNFRDTDIQELIKFVADRTKKTIVVDPKVKGKVKVISSKQVNEKELYNLFLSILDVHDFAAIESDGVIRIVPSKSARSLPVKVTDNNFTEETSEIVTHVIQLENVNAAKMIPILRPLVPQQAHMAAYAESNAIIISDTSANIARIRKVIDLIDKSSFQETDIVHLEHASAEEAVRILDKLEQAQPGGGTAKTAAPTKRLLLVADKRTNSVIISGDPSQRQRIKVLIKHLDTPLATTGNAKVVYLHYAKSKDLAEVLTKVTQNMAKLEQGDKKSNRATAIIEADEPTNSLIITADADVMQALDSIIKSLDIPRAQVLVEAIIVEVQDRGGKNLGIEWMFANENDGFGGFANPDSSNPIRKIGQSINEDDDLDRLAAIGGAIATTPGGSIGIGRLKVNGTSFSAVLQALEENGESNILSTPSLLTLDNQKASIVVGQEVPFLTGSYTSTGDSSSNPGNPFQTIERKDVGISLSVTPHINEGDGIVLELIQEVSSLTGAEASDLITNQRKIETSVMTGDGEVIVLGGLIQDEVQESERKVPILGDIPLLGRLFRSTSSKLTKTNLLVFIRPTIIRDAFTLREVTAGRYEYIRNQQVNERLEGINLYPDDRAPVLPEWEEQIRKIEEIKKSARENEQRDEQANTQAAAQ